MVILISLLFVSAAIALAGCQEKKVVEENNGVVKISVGYLPTDHHAALFVACYHPEIFKKYGIYLKEVEPKKKYELYKNDKKIADIELYLIKTGGADIMNLLAQGKLDIGLNGVPPAVFYIDKGCNGKIIMCLQGEGSAVVVRKDIPANNWQEFVNWIKEQYKEGKQVKIGHPLPTSIQYVMIKDALKASGISYTENPNEKAMVLLVNCKGQGSMPQMLSQKQLDAVIAWEPMPEILKSKGVGKAIVYSQDLPKSNGGTWKNHPCCCVVASEKSLKEKRDAIITFAKLLRYATEEINKNRDLAAEASTKWLGVDENVEKESVKYIKYDWRIETFLPGILEFVKAMNNQGLMKNMLKDVSDEKAKEVIFDFNAYNEIKS